MDLIYSKVAKWWRGSGVYTGSAWPLFSPLLLTFSHLSINTSSTFVWLERKREWLILVQGLREVGRDTMKTRACFHNSDALYIYSRKEQRRGEGSNKRNVCVPNGKGLMVWLEVWFHHLYYWRWCRIVLKLLFHFQSNLSNVYILDWSGDLQ